MGTTLKPCPFCGFEPDPEDADCIYPIIDHRADDTAPYEGRMPMVWELNCYETGGGCSASILGDTRNDVIERWNKRVK